MFKALFLEHEEANDGEYKIYSDGSKSSEGVGFAAVADDLCGAAKLLLCFDIYSWTYCHY